MLKTGALLLLGFAATSIAYAEQNVRFTGDFESGKFMPNGGSADSFFVKTLPHLQIGRDVVTTGSGGGGPTSNWDTKVVVSELVGGQLVMPRRGNFFARHMLHYDKDYRGLNNGVLKKARAELGVRHDKNRIDFDTEAYAGFSIFVPDNFEHETGTSGDRGSAILVVLNTDSAADLFTLRVFVPKGEREAHWFVDYPVNPHSVSSVKAHQKRIDLGPVDADKGQWTDFVLRFRANPFSVTTNPADKRIVKANDQTYQGNKGILQLWKAEGAADGNGNRRMVRKINVVDTPVGNVPGITQGESLLGFSMRIYKYKWQTMRTSVKGPVWIGFDEFRLGEVVQNGTSYSDVHPTQLACTDGCPGNSSAPPPGNPPSPPPGGQPVPPGVPPVTPGATPGAPEDLTIVP